MNRPYVIMIFRILTGLLVSMQALATTITVVANPNPAVFGESFQLVFEADGEPDAKPNFKGLNRDFKILATRRANASFIDGSGTPTHAWHLTLQGRRIGLFTIPSIPFGKDRSPSSRITITPALKKLVADRYKQPIILEAETDRSETWVQAQVLYTVRLIQSIELKQLSISKVKTSDPDAIIEKLGAVTRSKKVIDGIPHLVTELRYAVFPQQSGELTFEPVTVQGRITARDSLTLLDRLTQQGRTRTIDSNSVSVHIKPRPDQTTASEWLPAHRLTLADSWSTDIKQLKIGDSLTRTITLRAEGATGTQLPDFEFPDVDGLKQYPDQALIQDKQAKQGLVGTKIFKVALIINKDGYFILPAITVAWWNTRTGKREITRLNEVLLETSGIGAAPANQDNPASAETPSSGPDREDVQVPTTDPSFKNNFWAWISLALATGWLATGLLFIKKHQRVQRRLTRPKSKPIANLQALEKVVLAKAKTDHAIQCKDALLRWGQARWPQLPNNSLPAIAAHCPDDLKQTLLALNASLYSPHTDQWEASQLADAFNRFMHLKTSLSSKNKQ
ncbi:BatD, partial [hydrothermal vent metagenome]